VTGKAFLFVATPCHGGVVEIRHLNAVLELQAACAAKGIGFHLEHLEDDRVIARARARLAARYLAHPEATHLLFVDADIAFAPENAFRLLEADKDLVGGVYPLKHIDWTRVRAAAEAKAPDLQAAALNYVIRFLPDPRGAVEVTDDGFARVGYVGTGFMLIRREALERVAAAHPELTAELEAEGRTAMVFEPMIEAETGEYLSEDYAFCRRFRDLGGEIWADVAARLVHAGPHAFAGSLVEAMRKG
jgi:GT2 family glycosyltransferase